MSQLAQELARLRAEVNAGRITGADFTRLADEALQRSLQPAPCAAAPAAPHAPGAGPMQQPPAPQYAQHPPPQHYAPQQPPPQHYAPQQYVPQGGAPQQQPAVHYPAAPPSPPHHAPPPAQQPAPQPAAAQHGTIDARAADEKRIDPADGNAYTRQEFIECYGTLREWDAAPPVPSGRGRGAPAPAPVPAAAAPAPPPAAAPLPPAGGGGGIALPMRPRQGKRDGATAGPPPAPAPAAGDAADFTFLSARPRRQEARADEDHQEAAVEGGTYNTELADLRHHMEKGLCDEYVDDSLSFPEQASGRLERCPYEDDRTLQRSSGGPSAAAAPAAAPAPARPVLTKDDFPALPQRPPPQRAGYQAEQKQQQQQSAARTAREEATAARRADAIDSVLPGSAPAAGGGEAKGKKKGKGRTISLTTGKMR